MSVGVEDDKFGEKGKEEQKPVKQGSYWWQRTPCVALFKFSAANDDELDLEYGDCLELIDERYSRTNDEMPLEMRFKWALVRRAGAVAWVPRAYVELLRVVLERHRLYDKPSWYMNGDPAAIDDLLKCSKTGTFVITPAPVKNKTCTNKTGYLNYRLRIRGYGDKIHKYSIERDAIGRYVLENYSSHFPNLFNLVNRFYAKDKTNTLALPLIHVPKLKRDSSALQMVAEVPLPVRPSRGTLPGHRGIFARLPPDLEQLLAPYMIKAKHLHVNVNKCLGQGHFSKVYKAMLSKPGQKPVEVAVKQIFRLNTEYSYLREAEIMIKLNPPLLAVAKSTNSSASLEHKITELIGICSCKDSMALVMEFVRHGSLHTYLHERLMEKGCMDEFEKLNVLAQIADGMSFMHEKLIIHRDLATRNCLVEESLEDDGNTQINIKLADFGLARQLEDANTVYKSEERDLPFKWMAIEALKDRLFSLKSDVWSYAVVIFEVLTHGQMPYPRIDIEDLPDKLANGYRMPLPHDTITELENLTNRCWKEDPKERPDFPIIYEALYNMVAVEAAKQQT